MKYLLLLLMISCGVTKPGALDELQSGRCPDKYSCDVGYTCMDKGKQGMVCVKNDIPPMPKPDMETMNPDMSVPPTPVDPKSLACFKMYFSGYKDEWYPKNWYTAGGLPQRGCVDCTASFTSQKCLGRKVQEWDCMTNGSVLKFVEGYETQFPYIVVHINGVPSDRYQGIENAGMAVCEITSSSGICSGPYVYYGTYCDQYM